MRSPAVDNFLFDQPEEIRVPMEVLRDIIFAQVKGVEEQLKWNVPFYSKNGFLCYLNYDRKLKKVVLAFVEGFLLEDKYHALTGDTRNIKKLMIDATKDIPLIRIRYYLLFSALVPKSSVRA